MKKALLAAAVIAFSSLCHADDEKAEPIWKGLELSGGVQYDARANAWRHTNTVKYKGETKGKSGEPLANLTPTQDFIAALGKKLEAEPRDVSIDIENGTITPGNGTLMKFLGSDVIKFKGLNTFPFRTVTRLTSDFGDKQTSFSLGAEAPSIKPVKGLAGYIKPGLIVTQVWKRSGSGQDELLGTFTLRHFTGRIFSFGSDDVLVPFDVQAILKAYPTFEDLKKWNDANLGKIPANDLDVFVKSLFQAFLGNNETRLQTDYEAYVREKFAIAKPSYAIDPRGAFWLEGESTFDFVGNKDGKKAKHSLAAIINYWIPVKDRKERAFIQLRGDIGHQFGSDKVLRGVTLQGGVVF